MLQDINTSDEEMRPIAVHVDEIVYDVNLKHAQRRRVAVVDLEFSKVQVEKMIQNLQKRLENNVDRGTVRVRFKGRMVLE